MVSKIHALLIDLDGVLYQESQRIPGAPEAVQWLIGSRIPHLFLTNTTSRPRSAIVEKLSQMGIDISQESILTPPVAAVDWLRSRGPGPVGLFAPVATREDFDGLEIAPEDPSQAVSAVVVGDYGPNWTYDALNVAFRWLMSDAQPPLVALGMTRYWRAADGLRLDTGPFVAALELASGRKPVVLGKPARGFFETALRRLNIAPEHACMVGDDIESDIGGAQALGIQGMLVKTGKFQPRDLDRGPRPMVILPSFADLPAWWAAHH